MEAVGRLRSFVEPPSCGGLGDRHDGRQAREGGTLSWAAEKGEGLTPSLRQGEPRPFGWGFPNVSGQGYRERRQGTLCAGFGRKIPEAPEHRERELVVPAAVRVFCQVEGETLWVLHAMRSEQAFHPEMLEDEDDG